MWSAHVIHGIIRVFLIKTEDGATVVENISPYLHALKFDHKVQIVNSKCILHTLQNKAISKFNVQYFLPKSN